MFKQFLLLLLSISTLSAENILPKIFSDNMVLQRGIEVPVWGWTKPVTKVTVSFAGQSHEATSDAKGKWLLKLDKLTASKSPKNMQVNVGGETKVIKNILVGEVWLCSGQSNMQFVMVNAAKPSINKKYRPINWAIKKEMEKATDPLLRQISVGRVCSPFDGAKDITGKWLHCEPKSNPFFTAAGYYFAKELRRKLDVPVGLVVAAWELPESSPGFQSMLMQNDPQMKKYYDTLYSREA